MPVVVQGLKTYGKERLRIANGSIVPRATTGSTVARPCIVDLSPVTVRTNRCGVHVAIRLTD
jgi:hypothetical protein